MTTREKILELFEANRERFLSGEEIARKLSVSRTSVWKAVRTLQKEGYAIRAVTNRGYCLSAGTDILSEQGIRKYLEGSAAGLDMAVLPAVPSTNRLLLEEAGRGAEEGRLLLAGEQTEGRGRTGRSFFSPGNTGVYMSLLLRPENYSAKQAVRLTTMAAVAVCEAIEKISGEDAGIKWVNDIYVRGRKVCGILTEASFSLESGMLDYAVLGIGMNVYEPEGGFPEELADVAGAVFRGHRDDGKNRLAAEILNCFYRYYRGEDPGGYVEKYRKRSLIIGKQVTLTAGKESRSALVLGIDDDCRLLIRYPDGTEDCRSSGEVSVRMSPEK